MRMSACAAERMEKPRLSSSSCMLETPRSANTPSKRSPSLTSASVASAKVPARTLKRAP